MSDNFLNNGSIGIKSIARSPFGNKDELYAVTDISTSGNRGELHGPMVKAFGRV